MSRVATQPIRSPAQAVGLRQHPQRHRPLVDVAGGRQPPGRVVLQLPVDLVREQQQPVPAGDLDHRLEALSVHQVPGRVVRAVEHHRLGLLPHQRRQRVRIEAPAVALLPLPPAHLHPPRLRHAVERLVGRRVHHQVVARLERHVHEGEDRLLGTGVDQHVARPHRLVDPRDRLPQLRIAGALGVPQPEPRQPPLPPFHLERQQLGHRPRLAVARREQVPGGELVAGEVALEVEGGEGHGWIVPCGDCIKHE